MNQRNAAPSRPNWSLLTITWIVVLLVLIALAYKFMFQKQVGRTVDCLDQAASAQRATSPLTSVEKYTACIAWISGGTAPSPVAARTARCRFAGVWAAARGGMVYEVTLDADGKFVAEPAQNTPADAQAITGAWGVAGNSMVWAYDSGAVWPPDINPLSAQGEKAFTLTEVNGSTTRYTLIERRAPAACSK